MGEQLLHIPSYKGVIGKRSIHIKSIPRETYTLLLWSISGSQGSQHYILTVVMSTASCASPLPPHLLRSDPSRCIVVLKDPFVKLCERANSVHDSEIQEIMSNLIQTSRPSSSHDPHISGSSSHSTTPSADAMIYKLKLEMDTRFNRLHSEITGLKNENSGLNNEITGLYNEITGLNNEITGLNNEITGLNNEITGLNNEITGLKNGNTGFKTEITRLNNKITVLQNENTGFKERISELETGEAAQKKEIAEVRAGDRKNRGRIGRLEAQIKETKNERDEYRSARDKVNFDNKELNATVRDLEERLETLEDLGWAGEAASLIRIRDLIDKTQAYYARCVPGVIPASGLGDSTPSQLWRSFIRGLSDDKAWTVRNLVEANKDNFVEAARELVKDTKSVNVLCGLDRTHRERGDREAHLPTTDGDAYEKAIKLLVCDVYEPVFYRMLAVLKEDKDANKAL